MRLRGHLHGPRAPGTVCQGLRAGRGPEQAGGFRVPLRAGFLRFAAQRGAGDAGSGRLGGAGQLQLRLVGGGAPGGGAAAGVAAGSGQLMGVGNPVDRCLAKE